MIFAAYRIYNKCRASCSHSTQTTLVVLLERTVERNREGSCGPRLAAGAACTTSMTLQFLQVPIMPMVPALFHRH